MSRLNLDDPPHLFMPPVDMAHDIYSLSDTLTEFNSDLYQDIQSDQRVFDSFQRWPYLFSLAMPEQDT
ncbi:MAG: hypothetical protein R3194_06375 [Limnobacter sp.]|nr:hypothetical protein [Limnobacter sp.]